MESWVQSWRPRINAFCDFSTPSALSAAQTEDLMLQNGTCLRKWAPGPINISDEHVSCTAPATENASSQIRSSSYAPRLSTLLKLLQNRHLLLIFDKVHNPLRLPCETTSQCPKVVRTCGAFNILTWKRASRHSSVHFFDISNSTNAPTLKCSVHFDLEMCFAPQLRALLRHLNFQACSEREVFLAFLLANVLRATTACNFSSLIWPDCSEPAALASLLLDPPQPQIIGKNTVNHDFFTCSRTCIFSLLTLSLLWSSLFCSSPFWLFPSLLFHLSILSEGWLLNYSTSCKDIGMYLD